MSKKFDLSIGALAFLLGNGTEKIRPLGFRVSATLSIFPLNKSRSDANLGRETKTVLCSDCGGTHFLVRV